MRFRPIVLAMYAAGVRVFVQVGQGRLGGLIDDTLGFLPHLTIAANSSRRSGLDQLRRVAVALWVEGGAPDFDALKARSGFAAVGASPHEDSLPQRDPVRWISETRRVTLDPAVLPRTDPASAPCRRSHRRTAAAPVPAAIPGDGGLERLGPSRSGRRRAARPAHRHGPHRGHRARTGGRYAGRAVRGRPDPAGEYGGESVGEYDRQPDPIETTTTSVPVSLESMPYLLDHCLAPQRRRMAGAGGPAPVVPATTIVG